MTIIIEGPMMNTIKHGPMYLTKRLRDRIASTPHTRTIMVEGVPYVDRDRVSEMYVADMDNPAWPDLSEKFTPTMAGLPEPEPDFTAWRSPWFWSVLLTFYALMIGLICLLVTGG